MSETINDIKKEIRENIQFLIYNGDCDNASNLIDEYEKMYPDDVESYSIKSVISIMQENLVSAEDSIKKGLFIDGNNFDLLHNYAYLKELTGETENILKYYNFAYRVLQDDKSKLEVKNEMLDLVVRNSLDFDIDKYLKEAYSNQTTQSVLILCNFYSPYMKGYMEKLKERYNISFDVVTAKDDKENSIKDNGYYKYLEIGIINKIFTYKNLEELGELLNSAENYDCIHIHYLAPFYGVYADLIRKKCRKLIITIWGSDFYRMTKEDKQLQIPLIELSDAITFDNDITLKEFGNCHGEKYIEKSSINRFGLTAIDYIDRLKEEDINIMKRELEIPDNVL